MRGRAISSSRKILLVSIAIVRLAARQSYLGGRPHEPTRPWAHARFHSLRPSARLRIGDAAHAPAARKGRETASTSAKHPSRRLEMAS
eukprot:6390395-Pyramimonas_sp.AAC.1